MDLQYIYNPSCDTDGASSISDEEDRSANPVRSRSQEGRPKDEDDREQESSSYLSANLQPRGPPDDRDSWDRETREKLNRINHQWSSFTNDNLPPLIVPAAPSFDSISDGIALMNAVSLATGEAPLTRSSGPSSEKGPLIASAPRSRRPSSLGMQKYYLPPPDPRQPNPFIPGEPDFFLFDAPTSRVSRAKKGVPVHTCDLCKPPKVSSDPRSRNEMKMVLTRAINIDVY